MLESYALMALAAIDIALIAAVALRARNKGRRLGLARYAFMLLIPISGAIVIWLLTRAEGKPPIDGEWMKRNEENYQSIMSVSSQAAQTVPLEEALLINDPQKRRALMMNMLRSDPRKYMDILLVARFNEDQETAHYATATLLEVQHQTQLELQRLQARIKRHPADDDARAKYIWALQEYCDSGLLEAQLLRHQRLLLAEALEAMRERAQTPEFLCLEVRNHLNLEVPSKARDCAQYMLDKWPLDERSWLEMMRVCVETRDKPGMDRLLDLTKDVKIEWTSAGYERLKYWTNRAA